MAKKSLVSLAKGGSKSTTAKKPVEKVVEKPKTPEEERDLKAKAKVEELLQGVDFTPKKDDELLEVEPDEDNKSVEWLQEQVTLLGEQAETLRSELAQAKDDYAKVFELYQQVKSGAGIQDNSDVATNVTKLFIELQNAYIQMGINQTGQSNLIIYPVAFMNKLIDFFPFLANYKRF